MIGKLKKLVPLIVVFLVGAAVGFVIMQIRWVGYWKNEDRMNEEYRDRILSRIDNGYYSLPDGNFYLNGDRENAYYKIKDGTIQLFANDDQLMDYYYAKCAGRERLIGTITSGTAYGNTNFTERSDYEQTLADMKAYIDEPADYIFDFSNSTKGSGVMICAEVLGKEDIKQYIHGKEEGGVFLGGNYLNENVFEFDECVWVRL